MRDLSLSCRRSSSSAIWVGVGVLASYSLLVFQLTSCILVFPISVVCLTANKTELHLYMIINFSLLLLLIYVECALISSKTFIAPVRKQKHPTVLCVCVFFPSILDIKFVGRTSRGHTGGRSHRIFNPPSFCGACLDFCREKDSAIPFPRRP